jgi:hypothetical protein
MTARCLRVVLRRALLLPRSGDRRGSAIGAARRGPQNAEAQCVIRQQHSPSWLLVDDYGRSRHPYPSDVDLGPRSCRSRLLSDRVHEPLERHRASGRWVRASRRVTDSRARGCRGTVRRWPHLDQTEPVQQHRSNVDAAVARSHQPGGGIGPAAESTDPLGITTPYHPPNTASAWLKGRHATPACRSESTTTWPDPAFDLKSSLAQLGMGPARSASCGWGLGKSAKMLRTLILVVGTVAPTR